MKDDDDDDFLDINYRKAKIFLQKKIPVHIILRDGIFYNGILVSVENDFFEILDNKEGIKVVFFLELRKIIEEFTEVGR